ncbi:MAG: nicotinate (nicotinamide) nucleotide adenylyltransferase [candidate division Zixibacteria bacterium]|nr:nicotinate (nicotinamide) nucleotide adenylyltransferase [candidate division Zixibacteria bacterium]
MGGIFDPIHYGHLILAQSAQQAFRLDCILFLPSFNPQHRTEKPVASFDDRCLMIKLAFEENDRFVVSDMERELKIPDYTLNVIKILKQNYPEVDWHLILGADNIAQFDKWYRPDELVQEVKIVIGNRPGYDEEFEKSKWAGLVQKYDMPLLDISSTMIRKFINEGKSIRYLLPEAVRQYILSRGLYS